MKKITTVQQAWVYMLKHGIEIEVNDLIEGYHVKSIAASEYGMHYTRTNPNDIVNFKSHPVVASALFKRFVKPKFEFVGALTMDYEDACEYINNNDYVVGISKKIGQLYIFDVVTCENKIYVNHITGFVGCQRSPLHAFNEEFQEAVFDYLVEIDAKNAYNERKKKERKW
jgi:hypothetical protein